MVNPFSSTDLGIDFAKTICTFDANNLEMSAKVPIFAPKNSEKCITNTQIDTILCFYENRKRHHQNVQAVEGRPRQEAHTAERCASDWQDEGHGNLWKGVSFPTSSRHVKRQ